MRGRKEEHWLFGTFGSTLKAARGRARRRLWRYHPDKVAHLAAEFTELANEKTQEINDAHAVLLQYVTTR